MQATSLERIHVAQWDGTTAGATEFLRALAAGKWVCLSLYFADDIYIERTRDVACAARDQRRGRFLCARLGQRHFAKDERSMERQYRARFNERARKHRMLWKTNIVVGSGEWAVSLDSSDQGPYLAIYADNWFRTRYALCAAL